jgi:hypothetical protein
MSAPGAMGTGTVRRGEPSLIDIYWRIWHTELLTVGLGHYLGSGEIYGLKDRATSTVASIHAIMRS